MKTANNSKKQSSQESRMTKNSGTHIKIAKPRPTGTDTSVQGPRDCFPLG